MPLPTCSVPFLVSERPFSALTRLSVASCVRTHLFIHGTMTILVERLFKRLRKWQRAFDSPGKLQLDQLLLPFLVGTFPEVQRGNLAHDRPEPLLANTTNLQQRSQSRSSIRRVRLWHRR